MIWEGTDNQMQTSKSEIVLAVYMGGPVFCGPDRDVVYLKRGSGIIGLKDRVEALGGTISVLSPPGHGTALHIQLPADPMAVPALPGAMP